MRFFFPLAACLLLWNAGATAQATDTTIYEIAEKMPLPLLASCQPERHLGWTEDSIRRCAQNQLLSVLANNIRYPEAARQDNIEGTVVTGFIVETNGRISNIQVLKDIGGGCGAEAARVLQALDEAGLRWVPAQIQGKPVRMRQAIPLKFRLQEALPYYIDETGDSIYIEVDTLPAFQGGDEALVQFVLQQLAYPAEFLDSCKTGIVETDLIIAPDGNTRLGSQVDFNALGMDFQWESIRLLNRTKGMWTPARYHGRPVTTAVPLRTMFKSNKPQCKTANERFEQALLLANEAAQLAEQNQLEQAVEKWGQALQLHPDNTELLYFRGSALLSLNRRDEACADFERARQLLKVTWFESLRRMVCGW